ncbi:MAG: DNA-3-methyladenine glycosylase family protein [Eubacteriales bacterium]
MKGLKSTTEGIRFQIDYFDIDQTFGCGQCFRWSLADVNTYVGVVGNQVLEITLKDGEYHLNVSMDEFINKWRHYFDFTRDYSIIIKSLSVDDIMRNAVHFASGIRLLNQDEWETLISFIISSNNNIPRIKKIIECICQFFGKKVTYKGKVYYSFPTPKELEGITLEDLKEIRCGYRGAYILDAIQKVSSGDVDLYGVNDLDTQEARNELMKIKGVGPKVADCILLFSMGKTECYPIDVWIKKTTEDLYFKKQVKEKEIKEFAANYWGNHAGFAQQYLFHYARNKKVRVLNKGGFIIDG